MAEQRGDLHVTEEFGRSKRYLLWSCSLAILLWAVHVENGTVESPMLGTSAKISIDLLRGAIWIACAYFYIGFRHQARNVERTNSQMLYATQLGAMRERLNEVATQFSALGEAAQTAALKLLDAYGFVSDKSSLQGAFEGILKVEYDRINENIQIHHREEWRKVLYRLATYDGVKDPTAEEPEVYHVTYSSLAEMIRDFFDNLAWNAADRAPPKSITKKAASDLLDLVSESRMIGRRLNILGGQFNHFSEDILNEHLVMFKWYDKYLSNAVFTLATLACAWPLIVSITHFAAPAWLVAAGVWLGTNWPLFIIPVVFVGHYWMMWRPDPERPGVLRIGKLSMSWGLSRQRERILVERYSHRRNRW